ncbi:uncharacterized protein LOC129289969 [Prosopis cineraria]|uniref:uncharacterized protein LOC129289969 n=1 Tax=Prosopis cineraria TaxID=364024 RepID=UPI00240F3A67|nr:uncharacterized protein LOC129289969 [Prosopis cineraria]
MNQQQQSRLITALSQLQQLGSSSSYRLKVVFAVFSVALDMIDAPIWSLHPGALELHQLAYSFCCSSIGSISSSVTTRQIMDMGGGNWDRGVVSCAFWAAFHNPERAVDYLYSGTPEATEAAEPIAQFPISQTTEASGATVRAASAPGPNMPAPSEVLTLNCMPAGAVEPVFNIFCSKSGAENHSP